MLAATISSLAQLSTIATAEKKGVDSFLHLVQLGAGRGNLLDAELAEFSLELTELLGQLLLVLAPKLGSPDFSRRLTHNNQHPAFRRIV